MSNRYWRQINSAIDDQSESSDVEVMPETKKIGRWVYQLCISDGITSLFIDDKSNLLLGDFGQIIQFNDDIKETWQKFFRTIPGNENTEIEIGGARHTSAIMRAYSEPPPESKGRIVFCISQDGYIDVYMKDDWLKLR